MNLAVVPAHHIFSLRRPPLFTYFLSVNHCLVTIATLGGKKCSQLNLGQSVKKIDGWEVFA